MKRLFVGRPGGSPDGLWTQTVLTVVALAFLAATVWLLGSHYLAAS